MSAILAKKINDELLEGVSGGIIFDAANIDGADKKNHWEVLDDTNGNTLARFDNEQDARAAADRLGKNHMKINWNQVLELRGIK